jgi:hypothetical protein
MSKSFPFLVLLLVAGMHFGRASLATIQLKEHTQATLPMATNGSTTSVIAFVNPATQHSGLLHPLLVQLSDRFYNVSDVTISFVDVSRQRKVPKLYAIQEVPTILVFPKGVPKCFARILYHENYTFAHYERVIQEYAALAEGYSPLPPSVALAFDEALSVALRSEKELTRQSVTVAVDGPAGSLSAQDQGQADAMIAAAIDDMDSHIYSLRRALLLEEQRVQTAKELLRLLRADGTKAIGRRANDRQAQVIGDHQFLKEDVRNTILIEMGMLRQLSVATYGK